MLKFKFRKEKLILTPQIMLFKEFSTIFEHDKTADQTKANNMMKYVFYMCDLSEDNPHRDAGERKHDDSMKAAFGSRSKIALTKVDKERMEKAMQCYIKYNETAEERLLKTFDETAYALRAELDDTIPETVENEKDGVITFVSNSQLISLGLSELNDIKTKRELIVAAVRREAMSTKIRGQAKLSPLSKGEIELVAHSDAISYNKSVSDDEKFNGDGDNAKIIQRERLSRIEQFKAKRIERLKAAQGL
jgi:hypothetical protein